MPQVPGRNSAARRKRDRPDALHERRHRRCRACRSAADDAPVGVEQDDGGGVVELAVGKRAVLDAEHGGELAHGGCVGARQRPARRRMPRSSAVVFSTATVSRAGSKLTISTRSCARSAGAAASPASRSGVEDHRADELARAVEHAHQHRRAAPVREARSCGRPGRSAWRRAGRRSRPAGRRAPAVAAAGGERHAPSSAASDRQRRAGGADGASGDDGVHGFPCRRAGRSESRACRCCRRAFSDDSSAMRISTA